MSVSSEPFGLRLKAWRGIARSIAIYHLRRAHIRSLRELYSRFIVPGDLAFDIGSHVGDRTRVLHSLGARVVAAEPQPRLMRVLRRLYAKRPGITLVEAALSDAPGTIVLHVNSQNPTVSSASPELLSAAGSQPQWADQTWDVAITVPATTIDELIAVHGLPSFIKIDVEGLEDLVLRGMSQKIRTLSFEFTTLQRDVGLRAVSEAERLGYKHFDLSLGESHALHFGKPVSGEEMRRMILSLPEAANSGDVYCFSEN